ncbi:MAG: hypothetical protein IKT33_03975 [Clostridia bacterium]|nr:hypothetical protein [Clostridia bacterium]
MMRKLTKIDFKEKGIKEDSLQYLQEKYFNEILDMYAENLFPERDYAKSDLKTAITKFNDMYNYHGIALLDLNCHTRDDKWIQETLTKDCAATVSSSFVENYIKTSPVLDQVRREQEHALVKSYIQIYRDINVEDFADGIDYERSKARVNQDYDKLFYKRASIIFNKLACLFYTEEINTDLEKKSL